MPVFISNLNVLFLSNSQLPRNGLSSISGVFISNLNVLFLSNSQHLHDCMLVAAWVFISNLNVLFLSNSQRFPQLYFVAAQLKITFVKGSYRENEGFVLSPIDVPALKLELGIFL